MSTQVFDINISNIRNDLSLDDVHPRVSALTLHFRQRNENNFTYHPDEKIDTGYNGRLRKPNNLPT